jgi:hypothetical protein
LLVELTNVQPESRYTSAGSRIAFITPSIPDTSVKFIFMFLGNTVNFPSYVFLHSLICVKASSVNPALEFPINKTQRCCGHGSILALKHYYE